jgi:CRP-like cAMP-binding protein
MAGDELLKHFYLLRSEYGDDVTAPTPLRTMVEAVAERRTYQAGEIVFREGDIADAMYVVEQGTVEVVVAGAVVATRTVGEEIGEMPFFDGGRRSATARAGHSCHLIRVAYDSLRAVLRERPEAAATLYRNAAAFLTQRLRETTLDLSFARDRNRSHL